MHIYPTSMHTAIHIYMCSRSLNCSSRISVLCAYLLGSIIPSMCISLTDIGTIIWTSAAHATTDLIVCLRLSFLSLFVA